MGVLSFTLKIVLILALVVVLLIGGIALYFYKFHVFKTLTICVPDDAINTTISCTEDEFCENLFMNNITQINEDYENSPEFVKSLIDEVIDESVYCQDTCYIKQIYGDSISEDFEGECSPGDKAITRDLHGKEGLEFLSYVKERVTPEN